MLKPVVLGRTSTDGALILSLHIHPDLTIFKGHFEQLPIVPGIAQVDWALAFAAAELGTNRACRELRQLKFQRPMRPGQKPQLTLRLDASRQRLRFEYSDAEGVYSQGTAVLA